MLFGERLLQARKERKVSQEELAKILGVHAPIIGRYERDEVKPSIEMAAKIATVLEVSLDFLIGNSQDYVKDKNMLARINDILSLNDTDKEHILFTIDAMLRDAKTRKAYS